MRGTALDALHRMDAHDAIVAASTQMQGAKLVDRDGNVINELSGDQFGHRVGGDLEIMRGTLCKILIERVRDVDMIFGDSIESVSESSDRVDLSFRHGDARSFDLLLGADGLHSNVRSLVFGDKVEFLRDLGMYLCVYSVPNYLHLDRVEIQYSEIGRVAAIWATADDPNAKATFGFAAGDAPIDLRDRARQEAAVRERFAGVGWEVPRLLEPCRRPRTGTSTSPPRSICRAGRRVGWRWPATPATAPHRCPGRDRAWR